MPAALDMECGSVDTKRIRVSEKRQITIPKKFFEKLNLGDEVECFLRPDKNEIVIRPVRQETEFAEEILADLIKKGYSGQNLLDEFKRIRAKIRPAVKHLIEEAEQKAKKLKGSGDDEMKELFAGSED